MQVGHENTSPDAALLKDQQVAHIVFNRNCEVVSSGQLHAHSHLEIRDLP